MKKKKNSPSVVLHRFASTLARGKATSETADGVPINTIDLPIRVFHYLRSAVSWQERPMGDRVIFAWLYIVSRQLVPAHKAGAVQLVEGFGAP